MASGRVDEGSPHECTPKVCWIRPLSSVKFISGLSKFLEAEYCLVSAAPVEHSAAPSSLLDSFKVFFGLGEADLALCLWSLCSWFWVATGMEI